MSVKRGRLQSVIGLLLIGIGLSVLVAWILIGDPVYNGVPLLAVGVIVVGVILNRRSDRG